MATIPALQRIAAALTLVVAGCAAHAGSDPVPSGALAWWRYDPSAFPSDRAAGRAPGSERDILLATLRAALASGTLGHRTGAMLGALLLVGLEAGDTPHTLALLDFSATRPPTGTGVDIQSLAVAMRIDSGDRHADMLRTVRAVAIDSFHAPGAADPSPGVQARFDLPDGRTGVAFRKPDWEPWREVSWCSETTAFTIGIGQGALPTWFSPVPTDNAPPPWHALRAPIDAARPPAPIVFECYIDFRALRARFPSAFVMGRTPRMLAALNLQDAAALLFQARVVPATLPGGRTTSLMATDAAVLAPDDTISHHAFSHHTWPDHLEPALLPPGASSATVATVDWPSAFQRVLAIHTATITDRRLPAFIERRNTWLDGHRADLDELLAEFQPALVISTHERIPAPLPGVGCIAIPANPDAPAGRIAAGLERVLAPFHPAVRTDPPNQKAPSPVWSLRVDRTGLVRLPWWTLTRAPSGPAVLVGAWAAAPLETARRWLGGDAPP
jgi:hypothetical protein